MRLYPGDRPDVATSMNNLAVDLRAIDVLARARELEEEVLACADGCGIGARSRRRAEFIRANVAGSALGPSRASLIESRAER
jgi:hypothetical protein